MLRRPWRIATSLLLLALLGAAASRAATYEEGEAAFAAKDYGAAMRNWQRLAEDGHPAAQLGLARLYYGGLGVALDYDQAFEWCAKAADQGEADAQYILGSMYRDGRGVEADDAKAMALFLKAADHGIPGAQYSLGLIYMGTAPPDLAEAYYWLALAAMADGPAYRHLRMTAEYARDDAGAKLSAQQITELKRRLNERKTTPGR